MTDAGWSSLVARRAHNPKVVGSNPAPATNIINTLKGVFFVSATGKTSAENGNGHCRPLAGLLYVIRNSP